MAGTWVLTMLACLTALPAVAQVGVQDSTGNRVQVGRNGGVTATEGTAGARGADRGGADGGGCPGGQREIAGSNHRVTLAGPCSLVQVSGSRNVVQVRLAPGARVVLSGSGNQVRWTAADPAGAAPRFEVNGTGNSYVPGR